MNGLYITLGIVLLGAIIILLFAILLEINKYLLKSGKHPQLRWFMSQAITLAYKTSDQVFDITNQRLHSTDKVAIIKTVYDLLPDKFTIFKIPLAWKNYVSEAEFVEHVSEYYDQLVEQYHTLQQAVLREMVESIGATEPELEPEP